MQAANEPLINSVAGCWSAGLSSNPRVEVSACTWIRLCLAAARHFGGEVGPEALREHPHCGVDESACF